MAGLWIAVEGIGYGGFSAGVMSIMTEVNNVYYFHRIPCQGVSMSTFKTTKVFSVTNDVPGKGINILTQLKHKIIRVEIPDSLAVSGIIGVTFEVFEHEDDSEPVFKCFRRPKAKGFTAGEIKILTDVGSNARVYLNPKKAKVVREAHPPVG